MGAANTPLGLPKPVLTRWGYVSRPAKKAIDDWDHWVMLIENL